MTVTEILYHQAQKKQNAAKRNEPEKAIRKCAYPSCRDEATWDSFCRFHYEEEHYTSR